MQHWIANNIGGEEGKSYHLLQPNWAIPAKLKAELAAAKLGRTCLADVSITHELTGETCGAFPPNSMGGMSCDDIWATMIASEWPTASLGVWLCGQGHAPVGITEDSCPHPGCPVQKLHLAEVAARYWVKVASNKEEVAVVKAETYDSGAAAAHFATVFGNSRCGSHRVGWRTSDSSGTVCPDCKFSTNLDFPDGYDDSDVEAMYIAEEEVIPANVIDDGEDEGDNDQAELVEGSIPIWRLPLFNSKNKIPFAELVERALAEGMDPRLAGSHLRTFDIRDACWIFLSNKAAASGDIGEFANLLPKTCTDASEARISARLHFITEASKNKLPPGVESKRHSFSTMTLPPNTHVSRKRESEGQCGAPPCKVPRKFLMSPQDFVNCVSSFMAATLSKSAESIAPLTIAESILTRYESKVPGPKVPQTNSSEVAVVPKVVEHPLPALTENNNKPESESNKSSPHSMSEEPTAGPSQPKPGLSSRQKGMGYNANSHQSIISKPPISKPSYKEQKSNTRTSTYQFSPKSYRCGLQYGPGLYCEQLLEPWFSWCKACEKRRNSFHNTRSGSRGGPRGGPPRGGHQGGGRGNRGGRQGGRGSGHGKGITA